ncbi:peptidoglycan-binding protein [Rhizobium sp. BR 362]|uniref:peptidoglycan-binding protein n=1 Tax=Rhizobium sp. BR 362 TaxID=3040670 RepID=UPI002F40E81B
MRLSANGAADIRLHEGFSASWYADPGGVGTIGTGFTWASAAFRDWWARNRPGQTFARGATMTKAESDAVLQLVSDEEYGAAVDRFLSGRMTPQTVFDGATSVVFNCGADALSWTWATAIKASEYDLAGSRLLTTAVTQKSRVLAGLVARRKDEARLISKGIYASGGVGATMPDPAMADGILERGERGSSVLQLQERLIALGYTPGNPDGIFGYGTLSAVLAFQRASKLTADGEVGPKTLANLAA